MCGQVGEWCGRRTKAGFSVTGLSTGQTLGTRQGAEKLMRENEGILRSVSEMLSQDRQSGV